MKERSILLFWLVIVTISILLLAVQSAPVQAELMAAAEQEPISSAASGIVWRTRASLPAPRQGMGVAVVDNSRIFAIGGGNYGPSKLAVVEEYVPSENQWYRRADMQIARSTLGVTSLNGKIYAIGGWVATSMTDPAGKTAVVEVYDPSTNDWTVKESMPTARGFLGSAAGCDGKIYAIGGWDGQHALSTVEAYDPVQNEWQSRMSMPTPRWNLGVVAASNCKIYAIGGQSDSSPGYYRYYATVEEYDPFTDQWTTKTSMQAERGYLGVAASSYGTIYAVGGWNGQYIATVEEYDPGTDTWTTLTSMPTARNALGVAIVYGRLYAIGGEVASSTSTDLVEEGIIIDAGPERFLDLPIDYSHTDFASAAMGYDGTNPGRVNSWFDHHYPTYCGQPNGSGPGCSISPVDLFRWDGCVFIFANSPAARGESWYDGHNGIDFRKRIPNEQNEQIFAAAPGTVVNTVSSNSGYGNRIWVDHGNGYATLYGHLEVISVAVGTVIVNPSSQPLGIMGSTGRSTGIHLHFGVYYDQNGDEEWTEDEVVDPYGWYPYGYFGFGSDPWNIDSWYLWKYPINSPSQVGSSGADVSTPSGSVSAHVPPGALSTEVTVEMWDAPVPPESGALQALRSIGRSFWLLVRDWLLGTNIGNMGRDISIASFDQPVTITASYDAYDLSHFDTGRLGIYWWDQNAETWISLPGAVNTTLQVVTAQTTEPGQFDLQAPLLCPEDVYEFNDDYDSAKEVSVGVPTVHLFDISQDEDWFRLETTAGFTYTVQTSNLASGVNTVLELYDVDGVTLLAVDDNGGEGLASRLEWQATLNGTYFIRIAQAPGSVPSCDASYQIDVTFEGGDQIYLPIILKND